MDEGTAQQGYRAKRPEVLPLNADHSHRTYEEHDACRNMATPVAEQADGEGAKESKMVHSVQVTYESGRAIARCDCGWVVSQGKEVSAGGFVHGVAAEHLDMALKLEAERNEKRIIKDAANAIGRDLVRRIEGAAPSVSVEAGKKESADAVVHYVNETLIRGNFNIGSSDPVSCEMFIEMSRRVKTYIDASPLPVPTEAPRMQCPHDEQQCEYPRCLNQDGPYADVEEKENRVLHRAKVAESKLESMTLDRNLWKEAHDDDCPNKVALAESEREIERLKAALGCIEQTTYFSGDDWMKSVREIAAFALQSKPLGL